MNAPIENAIGPVLSSFAAVSLSVMVGMVVFHKGIAFRPAFIVAWGYFISASYRNTTVAWDLYTHHFPHDQHVAREIAGGWEVLLAITVAVFMGKLVNALCAAKARESRQAAADVDFENDNQMVRENVKILTGLVGATRRDTLQSLS